MVRKLKKYELVAGRIQELISVGVLKTGGKIPSVREMSRQMGLSIMTVLEGYRRLEDMGIIESQPQSGYYVRPEMFRENSLSGTKPPEAKLARISIKTESVSISPAVQDLIRQAARTDLVALGAGLPNPAFFPSEELSIRVTRQARFDPDGINQYCIGAGHEPLIDEFFRWMLMSGCTPVKDEIVVTAGATQALLLAVRAVTSPGDAVAVESPGYYGFYAVLKFLGLKAVEISSHPQTGLSVDMLKKACKREKRIKAVVLSPTFSNPTGATMPDENKQRLCRLAQKHGICLIEDDTYGDICFGQQRPRSLKSFGMHNTIYIGSLSKSLCPGYRIAWIAGGRYSEDILRCHAMAVLACSSVTQRAVASFLKDGGMKRHLRRLRKIYARNINLCQTAVARYFPEGTKAASPAGGPFLWVELPAGCSALELADQAVQHGISIAPGVLFSARQHYEGFIRFNCSLDWSAKVDAALETLGALLDKQKTKMVVGL